MGHSNATVSVMSKAPACFSGVVVDVAVVMLVMDNRVCA